MIVNVIVNNPNSNVDFEYSYNVPFEIETVIQIGMRVLVPFGNGNRLLMGYVYRIFDQPSDDNLKYITELLDFEPLISEKQIQLAKYIKHDTLSPLIRVLNLMIPQALLLRTKKYLEICDHNNIDGDLALLFNGKQQLEFTKNLQKYAYKIKTNIKKGYLKISYSALSDTNYKYINKYIIDRINENIKDLNFKIKSKLSLLDDSLYSKLELQDKFKISNYMVDKLVTLSILKKERVKEIRIVKRQIPVSHRFLKNDFEIEQVINKIQNEKLASFFYAKNTYEIDALVERVVRQNSINNLNTLIIVPDILSSYRVASYIRNKFDIDVATLNSEIPNGEILDYYDEIKNLQYSVIVTTPACSLYEFPNLNTIIMLDTESDNYYNVQSPRYNLKLVMNEYAKIYNIKLIYTSVIPCIEDYVDCLKGRYHFIESKKETEEVNVEVIDLKNELLTNNNSSFSQKLLRKIQLTVNSNKQVLLISNRKLFSNYIMCRSCGKMIECQKCSIPLQYSLKQNLYVCPACGLRYQSFTSCPECGEETFRYLGSGIEQMEKELQDFFPKAKIGILNESSYKLALNINSMIEDEEIQIIIATSVFSKSIFNDNIGLVCIMNLTEITGNQSYIANERAMTQLIHTKQLCLEKDIPLIIQTYQPHSSVVTNFILDDINGYLKDELNSRHKLRNAPFYMINRIIIKASYENVFKEANHVKKLLSELIKENYFIIGPTYNKTYQGVQLIVKHQNNHISDIYEKLYDLFKNSNVMLIFDKYPRYI